MVQVKQSVHVCMCVNTVICSRASVQTTHEEGLQNGVIKRYLCTSVNTALEAYVDCKRYV